MVLSREISFSKSCFQMWFTGFGLGKAFRGGMTSVPWIAVKCISITAAMWKAAEPLLSQANHLRYPKYLDV